MIVLSAHEYSRVLFCCGGATEVEPCSMKVFPHPYKWSVCAKQCAWLATVALLLNLNAALGLAPTVWQQTATPILAATAACRHLSCGHRLC